MNSLKFRCYGEKYFLFNLIFSISCCLHAQLTTPHFSIPSGSYSSDTNVVFYCLFEPERIFYTLDGTVPDSNSMEYSAAIPMTGDGFVYHFKVVAMDSLSNYSDVVEAYYAIDYAFTPTEYIDLTWEEYNDYILGNWIGHIEIPWCTDYTINMAIEPDGHYSSHALSWSFFGGADTKLPALYYGLDVESTLKNIFLYDMLPDGSANGFIIIFFGAGSTNEDELRYVRFHDRNNLYLQMWHQEIYGPLVMELVRQADVQTAAIGNIRTTFSMVPNPADNLITITTSQPGSEINTRIFDMNGRIVCEQKINSTKSIDISALAPGLYLVSLQSSSAMETLPLIVE